MERAKDLLTEEWFDKRRNNQKFVNRENQVRYNNNKAQQRRNVTSFFDRQMNQNRKILLNILGKKNEITKSRDFLLGAGYNFKYFMYIRPVSGLDYTGIYEFGITKMNETDYHIIRFEHG